MRNGCTIAALVSAMLNILNEISTTGVDLLHTVIAVVLAIATLIAIWRIDTRRRNGHGR